MEIERYQKSDGVNGVILHKIHRENKELVLSEKFANFQLVECQREKDVMVSELALLDKLLKQRKVNNEEEQTRLVQRYQSQFEKLRAECALQRGRVEPLERKINELVHREGALIKKLTQEEITTNKHKTLLESTRKKAETLKIKLSGTEQELKEKTQTCFKQEQEISDLAQKAASVSGALEKEKSAALKEMSSRYELELQDLKLSLVNKQLTIKDKDDELLTIQSHLQKHEQQVEQLSQMSNKIAKLEIEHQKAELKCRELKISEKENLKKSQSMVINNKRLMKKYEELKKKKDLSSLDEEMVRLIRRENLELKSKLAIQEKTLRVEINTLAASKKKMEKKLSKVERKMRNAQDKLSCSDEESNHSIRKLEHQIKRLVKYS